MKRFKGTKARWIHLRDAMGEGIFTERSLICRTHNLPNENEAKANAKLMSKSKELLKSTIELSDKVRFLMEQMGYKQQDIDGYLYRYKELIKEATEI